MAKRGRKTFWKDEFIFRAYELLKTGMTERNVAKALGISVETFWSWMKKKPLFALAVKEGRRLCNTKEGSRCSFKNYVVGRLPPELKPLWDKIMQFEDADNGTEKLDALLADQGVRVRQMLFMYAWWSSNFSVSKAMRKVGLARSTFELWKKDPYFLDLIREMQEIKKDFFDEHLCMLVAGGDTAATIFANKTFNRDRYPEKATVDVNVRGTIQHNVVRIDDLQLPLEVRKKILVAIREHKPQLTGEVVKEVELVGEPINENPRQ